VRYNALDELQLQIQLSEQKHDWEQKLNKEDSTQFKFSLKLLVGKLNLRSAKIKSHTVLLVQL
jgi:hypothetical protein